MHERLFCTAPLAILTSPLPHPSPPPLAVPSRVSLPPPASACAPTNYYVRQSLARPFSRSPPRNRSKFLLLTVLTVSTQSVLRTSLAWSLVTVCLSRVGGAGAYGGEGGYSIYRINVRLRGETRGMFAGRGRGRNLRWSVPSLGGTLTKVLHHTRHMRQGPDIQYVRSSQGFIQLLPPSHTAHPGGASLT